jgi:hypothetical protein
MINVYDVTNATAVTLFGIFALWAVASNRHWFLRTAAVVAAILVTLLIPAYEVLLTFVFETVLIALGIAIWRYRRRRKARVAMLDGGELASPPRLSIRTMMLAVVFVAVAAAVVGRMPIFGLPVYYFCFVEGFVAALTGLSCVWLICGKARWQLRLTAVPLLVFALSSIYNVLRLIGWPLRDWLENGTALNSLPRAFNDIGPSILAWAKPVAIGIAATCAWLYFVRQAGWFDPFSDTSPDEQSVSLAARRRNNAIAFGLFATISMFPLLLLYKLLTPSPLPTIQLPEPNGFDDFIAAGQMIGPAAARTVRGWTLLSTAQLESQLNNHQAAIDRAKQGLEKPSWNPFVFHKDWTNADSWALSQLLDVLSAQGELGRRKNNAKLELDSYMTFLKIAQEEARGSGADKYDTIFADYEPDVYESVWNVSDKLTADERKALINELRDLEADREPWIDRVERQRIVDENAGWEMHLTRLLSNWSGVEPFSWQTDIEFRHLAQLRMLIIKLALRAYQADHERLPGSLQDLVPEYLTELPNDPFSGKPFQYRGERETHSLYSFGPDNDDDHGKSLPVNSEDGDLTDLDLFPPPTLPRTRVR